MRLMEAVAGRSLYHPGTPQWWVSRRQRVVVLTFNTIEDALRWDRDPTLHHLVEMEGESS